MSVWFTESFRGQVLWDFARLGEVTLDDWKALARKTDISFDGGTLVATGEFEEITYPGGLAKDLVDRVPDFGFSDIFYKSIKDSVNLNAFGHVTKLLAESTTRFVTGIHATYALFSDLVALPKTFAATDASLSHDYVSKFMDQGFRCQVGIMKTTPAAALKAFERIDSQSVKEAARWQAIAEKMRSLLTCRRYGQASVEQRGAIPTNRLGKRELTSFHDVKCIGFPDDWSVHFDGWVTYVQTATLGEDEFYALSTVDLDRIQQMCISLSMLELHQAVWCMTAGNTLSEYLKLKRPLMAMFFKSLRDCTDPEKDRNPNMLCRDYRKVFNVYLSMAAGALSDIGTADLLKDVSEARCKRHFNVDRLLLLLQQAPFDIAQDLGRLYKLLPAPDYDIGASFVARQKQHLSMNPSKNIIGKNPCNLEEFRQYIRKLVIITLTKQNHGKGVGKHKSNRKPKWWADYLRVGLLPDRLACVDEIDLRGTAPYVERTPEGVAQWKDSAVCEEKLEDVEEVQPANTYRRNMLLRFLFDPTCPDAEKARINISRKEHVHRVGFKMEAHKTEARLFFIGNHSDRLVQSEMEENVHRIALHTPGYMIGQTPEFATQKVMRMVSPDLAPDESIFYLNFDISAWSPGMRDDIQRLSHEIWGEVFDRKEFSFAHKINEGAIVVLNKRGYAGAYVNPGANFEGYNGKEMTFLHCALMGYSVYRYRRATTTKLTIQLQAFIDDGLAAFKDKKENGSAAFIEFATIVEETYQALGFLLHKHKCSLSDKFAIFLNEIYWKGVHVIYGLRAIMRVGTKSFDEHETLAARANAYFSGTQGAMKAGLDTLAGFVTYLWLMGRLMLVYGASKFLDPKAAVLYMLVPRALGGLGSPSYVGLCTNLVTDGLTEGIATLQELARAYEPYKPKVISLLRQMVRVREAAGILISPGTVPDHLCPMIETRLKLAVANAMKKANLAPKAKQYVNIGKAADIQELAVALIENSSSIAPAICDDVLDATPYALFMALIKKFESSRTMLVLVGRRQMNKITRENRNDAMKSIQAFAKR
jgi:hypothetical protein